MLSAKLQNCISNLTASTACSEVSFLCLSCFFVFSCGFPAPPQAALQVGGHGERLHQCREVTLLTYKSIPMQVDGEPCRLAPSLIRISLRNQANMVQKSKRRTSMPLLNEWVGYVHVLKAGGPFGAAYSVMDFACTGLAAHLQKKKTKTTKIKKKNAHLLNSLSTVLQILTWFFLILLSSGLPSVLLLGRCCVFQLFREVCAGSAECLLASDSSA